MSRLLLTAALLASTILTPGLYAKKGGKGHNKHADEQAPQVVVFHSDHRRVIHDYYRVNPAGLPPGLAKRGGDLPPGLAKQLRRNGHLPPGLEKKMVPFPEELDRRFPPLPPHHRRYFIGDRAIIYDHGSGSIVDVLTVVINIRH